MNHEVVRLIDQLEREFHGDAWHGSSLAAILSGVSAEDAGRRAGPHAHTIWELVLHITGWKREVAERLKGKQAGDPAAGDWPDPGPATESRWNDAKADLERAHAELVAAIRALPPDRLHLPVKDLRDPALGTGMTGFQTICGVIQHDVYHAGQVAILKKLAGIRLG